ncbi:MAG: aldose 1-epimerase family protein [Acidobacteria bacterium]|nr:aldose 1-epimerase family protein [Acidobacteriota bacterium]
MAQSNAAQTGADPIRQTLTSAVRNVRLETWQVNSSQMPFKTASAWSIQKYVLHGGKQEGVDVIVLNSGKLTITVVPTRGMSVLRVESSELVLGWNSPVKEVVHPSLINLQNRGGLGWLEGFNEWMVRCGAEWAGHPGKDKFINNTGDEAEMDLTLHGRIGNIPASEVEVIIDRTPPHRLRIRGRVDERQFYGPKLELWTEVSTEPGSTTFRIEDTLTNYSAYEQEFELIYHANYGPPLLEKDSRFVGAVKRITPFNAHAAKSTASFAQYVAPTKGFVEQVYMIEPFADAQNQTTVMLHNAAGDKAVTMRYDITQLPYFTLWKNTTALEEGYVTGLEPGTSSPANRSIERKAGCLAKLKPNETRRFMIDVGLHTNKDEIARATAAIKALQGSQQMQVSAQPVKVE